MPANGGQPDDERWLSVGREWYGVFSCLYALKGLYKTAQGQVGVTLGKIRGHELFFYPERVR
jgi:hypothetical protein